MKKIKLLLTLPLCCYITTSLAESRVGVSIDDDAGVRIKKKMENHQVGFGANYDHSEYVSESSVSTLESKMDNYTLTVFYRYDRPINEVLNSFYEIELSYVHSEVESSSSFLDRADTNSDNESYAAGIFYGLEYFISTDFSIEGKFGLQYRNLSGDDYSSSSINAPSSGLAINYYW